MYVYIHIICREKMISVTRNVQYSQYYQRKSTVVYLKHDFFKWPSLTVFVHLFLLIFTMKNLKEEIQKVIVNIITQ